MATYQNTVDWAWEVVFADGGDELHEYVDGVHTHSYADIMREIKAGRQVRYMHLIPTAGNERLATVHLALQPGQVPVFYRRARMPMNTAPAEDDVPWPGAYTSHCIGLRRPGEGKRGAAYLYLFTNGKALLTTSEKEF